MAFIIYVFLGLLPIAYYLIPYLTDSKLRRFPAPFPGAYSDFWLFWQARKGKRYSAVHNLHKKHGKFVRVQPKHVSIADPAAIPIVYGHGTGFLKSDYYDAFVSIMRGIFNTRDRAEHTRKRKTISSVFSTKNVLQFEPYIHHNLELLASQFNKLSAQPDLPGGFHKLDILHWTNYLAFDIISDLTFGSPFGMLESGKDQAIVKDLNTGKITTATAIQVLNRRGEVSGTLGCAPWAKKYAKWFPDKFFTQGIKAVEIVAGIAVARVSDRLDRGQGADREDLLKKLMNGRDENGNPLCRKEIEAEALTMLIAGSDTTSNTLCSLMYWVLRTPGVLGKLQEELESALPGDWTVPNYASVKDLKYLRAVINETLRIHSTSSLGLPRVVPPQGATVCGEFFVGGTVLSVPSYTIHHSDDIWGDAETFRPERWFELTDLQKKSFIPFSTGPRACVGQNVAELEMVTIVATLFSGWDWKFAEGEKQGLPGAPLNTVEGFLRKPLGLNVGVKRRNV
ncbi:cytochrome P450 [Wilcoxina mikolae CBS 423.85]|nr:cytochrome P450 [Wilcoxina mikolae CBS 423.85]